MSEHRRPVRVSETHAGPYDQMVVIGTQTFITDEPEAVGGTGLGPDPYEVLLAALGSCTNMTLRMYANQKGLPLTHQSVTLTHHKEPGEDGLKVDVFTRMLTLQGDLTPEQRERLREIADRCPVSRTLEKGSRIITTLAE
jgi:uncharacterized OsmC-like protein